MTQSNYIATLHSSHTDFRYILHNSHNRKAYMKVIPSSSFYRFTGRGGDQQTSDKVKVG